MSLEQVTVRVPATSANLGPGYDCLGVALQLHNGVTVQRTRRRKSQPAIVEAVVERFFSVIGRRPFPFDWSIDGEVPRSRGLGSSVTVRLGLLTGLNALAGNPCDRQQLFELCSELEGHPDNAAPAQFGGFVVAVDGGRYFRFPVEAKLKFILLIPDFEVATDQARQVLPDQVPLADAAGNAARVAAITAAMATGKYRKLTGLFDDALHQPYRASLIPGFAEMIKAGIAAGALGGFLSGSGSTTACVALSHTRKIGAAMAKVFQEANPESPAPRLITISADNRGTRILGKLG